jgi:hypothetical protein
MKTLLTAITFVLISTTTLFGIPINNQSNQESCCSHSSSITSNEEQKSVKGSTEKPVKVEQQEKTKPSVNPKTQSSKSSEMNDYQRMDRGRKVLEYKYKLYA